MLLIGLIPCSILFYWSWCVGKIKINLHNSHKSIFTPCQWKLKDFQLCFRTFSIYVFFPSAASNKHLIWMLSRPCRSLWILPSNSQERMMLLCCIQKLPEHRDILTPHPWRLRRSELKSDFYFTVSSHRPAPGLAETSNWSIISSGRLETTGDKLVV